MNFSYQAYDKSGKSISGIVDASSNEDATEILRKKGLFVSSIVDSKGNGNSKKNKKLRSRGSKRVSPKVVSEFARELAVLVSTGTPLIDAISSIERQSSSDAWGNELKRVRQRLEEGDSLTSALEGNTQAFDAVFRSLVAAGESSGHLDTMLLRVAVLTRKQAQIRSNILGAMMYPILLTGVAVVVIGMLIGVVLPRFSSMFETLDTPLPASTAVLMTISSFVRSYWWGVIPAGGACIAYFVWWINGVQGQFVLGNIALKVPKLGDIVRSFMTARITRLMGVLLEAKVPMLDTINLTRESLGHQSYQDLMTRVEDAVTRGEPISSVFGSNELVVPSACEAIRNGEQSGRLADVLVHVSDYLDEDNETIIKSLSSLIEPVIMVVLGVLVGFVAISMFLPLFDLTATAGGGA
ncbi:MAG: type II secretion system F family protein [Phycisphaerales bacterium]|nr:type II secretion system F family protein [Phycisphaerales bacterium]